MFVTTEPQWELCGILILLFCLVHSAMFLRFFDLLCVCFYKLRVITISPGHEAATLHRIFPHVDCMFQAALVGQLHLE